MKLAICIPTYQRPDFIDELLSNEISVYQKLAIDVYIIDSSNDDETREVVAQYKKNFTNIFYYKFPAYMHSNAKVYRIFQMTSEIIKCDYVWVRSDAYRCYLPIMSAIIKWLELELDIYVLHRRPRYKEDFSFIIKDPQELFEQCANTMSLYGATILNVNKMIVPADWNYLSERYLTDDRINFSHVAFYFEMALKTNGFKALVINVPGSMFYPTAKKRIVKSFWYKDSIKMWLHNWPNLIESLPECYASKEYVIKDATYEMFLPSTLKHMADIGILTDDIYSAYREDIKKYTDIPDGYFADAAGKKEFDILDRNVFYELRECRELLLFVKNFDNIYIYGCGIKGKRYAEYLKAFDVEFEAFVISDNDKASLIGEFLGHKVVGIDGLQLEDDAGIVLGLDAVNQAEVYPVLEKMNLLDNTFSYPDSYAYIKYVKEELDSLQVFRE